MDFPRYCVVINDEEQHSIWPIDCECPPGWRKVGIAGTKEECLEHIARVWTDITPRSARTALTAKLA